MLAEEVSFADGAIVERDFESKALGAEKWHQYKEQRSVFEGLLQENSG